MPKLLPQLLDWPYSKLLEDPVGYIDVYIDDFIGLIQGPKNRCQEVCWSLLNTIDNVLDAPLPHKQHYKEPASVKKLLQGDGSWNIWKILLGWLVYTALKTLELPKYRQEQLLAIFAALQGCKRISINWWQ
jgi:hypothetical protein